MTKVQVCISRKWHHPKILTTVDFTSEGGIQLSLELVDFLEALRQEIGSVTTTLTRAQFQKKFDAAAERALRGVKEESLKVVK